MKCVLVICGLLLLTGCAVDESILRSLDAQDQAWADARMELIENTPTPEDLRSWNQYSRKCQWNLRRTKAALEGEEFDMDAEAKKLGIKKKGEK